MIVKRNHSFHLVDQRPWPLTGAIGALTLTTGIVKWFNEFNFYLLILGKLILIITCIQWWRDIRREGSLQGLHTSIVEKGLRWGIILFITSEVLFFFSFFWAFFHRSLSPTLEIGSYWPPIGTSPFNPFQVPLLNTIILLSSGVTVTWAHHALIERNYTQSFLGLLSTVILGAYFTALQGLEYWEASFTISDSVYGRTFFCSHWIPRPACSNRNNLSSHLPWPTLGQPLFSRSSFWLRSSSVILTFCRCGMTFPFYNYLLVR